MYVPALNSARLFRTAVPSRKLATSNPVFAIGVQLPVAPVQLDVWLPLKKNWPVIESALRISRDRSVRLPPAFKVWRPITRVTLSKTWKSFWFVMSGWLPFWPRCRAPPS